MSEWRGSGERVVSQGSLQLLVECLGVLLYVVRFLVPFVIEKGHTDLLKCGSVIRRGKIGFSFDCIWCRLYCNAVARKKKAIRRRKRETERQQLFLCDSHHLRHRSRRLDPFSSVGLV